MTKDRDGHGADPESGGAVATEDRPLDGRVVVVTRPEAQAADLVRPLEARGAHVVLFPTIRIVPPANPAPLREAAASVASYDWLVFTSVNGVKAFAAALVREGVSPPIPDDEGSSVPRVCAIGPATGAALEDIGLHPRVIPDEFVAEAVIEALDEETELRGKRILLPRAAVARSTLPDGLRARGAEVEVVEAYRTVPETGDTVGLTERLRAGAVDLVTFTASSTVRNFDRAVGAGVETSHVPVAAIGPITAKTARKLGYDVVAVAEEYTIPGLVRAVEEYFAGPPPA